MSFADEGWMKITVYSFNQGGTIISRPQSGRYASPSSQRRVPWARFARVRQEYRVGVQRRRRQDIPRRGPALRKRCSPPRFDRSRARPSRISSRKNSTGAVPSVPASSVLLESHHHQSRRSPRRVELARGDGHGIASGGRRDPRSGCLSGIRSELARLWSRVKELGLPCLVFVNELDKDGASFDLSWISVNAAWVAAYAAVVALGQWRPVERVLDLLQQKVHLAQGDPTCRRLPIR